MANDSDIVAPAASSFRQSTWTTPAVLVGLCILAVCRLPCFLPRGWLAGFPWWLPFTVTGIILSLFLLIYPLITRKQPEPNRFRLPGLKRLLEEAMIAGAVIVGCTWMVWAIVLAITYLFPDISIVPKALDRMGKSPGTPFVFCFLIVSFSYAPIAEEFFFRGFLFNAFRRRMSLAVAVVLQSAVFGLVHLPSAVHAIVAASLGLVLTMVYYWRQTIVAPIFVHVGFNGLWALGMFLSICASGDAPALGVIGDESPTECVIGTVIPGSPAESAGLLAGDTIQQVGDYQITDFQSLINAMSCYEAGDSVVVVVDREDSLLQMEVVLVTKSSLSTP